MDCLLINLDRSTDRFEWMTRQADAAGIVLHRVSAVDGKSLTEQELLRWENVRHRRFGMGPGEFGCFLSHRRAWSVVLERDGPWAFVAEDDVHLSHNLAQFLRSTDWIPTDADVIKGETVRQRVWLSTRPAVEIYGRRLHRLRSSHGGSAGYFINGPTARLLLDATEDFCSIPDQIIFNPLLEIARRLRIYQIDPAICIQDWCLKPGGHEGFESLLLEERKQFHKHPCSPNYRLADRVWYKCINPLKKACRRSLMLAANTLGTHRVKKVAFAN